MVSLNVFNFVLFAVTPLLAQAQQNQQTPLNGQAPELAISLTLDSHNAYSFKSALTDARHLDLHTLHKLAGYGTVGSHPQIVSIHIPSFPTHPGTMILGPGPSPKFRPLQEPQWIDTHIPGQDMPMTHVGIRKGDMLTMDAPPARLALETPYILLPGQIYDILLQATSPVPWQHDNGYDDIVDCDALERFPDLVLGLGWESEEEYEDDDAEEQEIVITPFQYTLEVESDKCILLARRAYQRGREEVVLGWAAMRGRDLVLDYVNERTGFGR